MIEVKNICKSYNEKVVLDNFSCQLPDTGFVAVTGESGAGKTTLLRILMGLEEADSGNISGKPYLADSFSLSVVFQEDRLLEKKSALDNVLLVCAEQKKAESILSELGLENDLNTNVCDLSGGMKRRVSIARALARDADIYICDEPIRGLDSENRLMTLECIRKHTSGKLLIMTSHDPDDFQGADLILTISAP